MGECPPQGTLNKFSIEIKGEVIKNVHYINDIHTGFD